jgi:hypothetical protein
VDEDPLEHAAHKFTERALLAVLAFALGYVLGTRAARH